ncbi:hypothetical protein [Streptomyces sp. NPDC004135]
MNLPTKTVLVPDTWRGQNDRVSVRDFWNTAGRAGRAGNRRFRICARPSLPAPTSKYSGSAGRPRATSS